MKQFLFSILAFISFLSYAQEKDMALQESNNLVYEGNELIAENEFVSAEMEYRKAISKKPSNAVASYDLGNAYYNNGRFDEALLRHTEAVDLAETRDEKHKAWHNIGNTLMQDKKCPEAVEAFKNALRNDPTDDESRYNLGIAKDCAKQQGGGGDEDKKDEDKEKEEKDGEKNEKEEGDKEEKEDEGKDDEQNEGDDKKDEKGDPKDEKQDENEGKPEDEKKKPQPQQAKLSPQQIKNLLEAMNNQEQKVQEKINAKKTKGAKIQTEKDW